MPEHADGTAAATDRPATTPFSPVEPTPSAAPARPAGQAGPSLSLEQILDATAECLAESGYDGTTIRRIAGRLSCAVGSIYRYCTDKRALLSQVTQRRFESVAQAVEDLVPLQRTVLQYAQIAAEDAQQYRLMFWLASLDVEAHASGMPPIVRRIIDGWTRQIGDPRAAERLWSQVHGGLALGLSPDAILSRLDANDLRRGRASGSPPGEEPAPPAAQAAVVDDTATEPVVATTASAPVEQGQTLAAAGATGSREDLTLL